MKKLLLFFLLLSTFLLGCSNKLHENEGYISEGDLFNKISLHHKDIKVNYKTSGTMSILEININLNKEKTPYDELEKFNEITDEIVFELQDITYYDGLLFSLSVDSTEKAILKSYNKENGKFVLKEEYIEEDGYLKE